MAGYEKRSDHSALGALARLERQVHAAYLRGDRKGDQARALVVLEGALEKNAHYRLEFSRGDATLAYWDYAYEYAFTVTRLVSLRVRE